MHKSDANRIQTSGSKYSLLQACDPLIAAVAAADCSNDFVPRSRAIHGSSLRSNGRADSIWSFCCSCSPIRSSFFLRVLVIYDPRDGFSSMTAIPIREQERRERDDLTVHSGQWRGRLSSQHSRRHYCLAQHISFSRCIRCSGQMDHVHAKRQAQHGSKDRIEGHDVY